jgi:NDP-sugar pyrophosphorylase family protein
MKAMVFAAGEGQRLRPITAQTPKPLVPVAGRPMIDYPLRLLRHYGVMEIIINLHHLGAQVEDYLGDGSELGLQICYSKEAALLDTGGGLWKAKPFLQDGTFIVINTDVVIDLALADVLAFHRSNRAAATLVLRPDADADRYGSMDVGTDGRIQRFLGTRAPGAAETLSTPARKLMFTGVQVLEPRVFEYMPAAGGKFSTTKDVYPSMLAAGEPLYGFEFDGFWQDLGTMERIDEAERALSLGHAKLHYL